MGKLIYGFNVSVDGYIADAQGNIDWADPSEELHQYWNDFERETACAFYGRRLYELMSAYWPTADQAPDATPLIVDFARIWRDMPKVVFSHTCKSVDWNSRLERGDPVAVVTKLKAETDGRLEVAGAAPRSSRPCRHGSRCDCWRTAPSRVARSCCATRPYTTDRIRRSTSCRHTARVQMHWRAIENRVGDSELGVVRR